MDRVIPEHTETDQYERRHHDSMIDKMERLVIQFARLQTWVTALAAISILFIGFVSWVMKSSLEDLSVTVRSVTETQRDVYYISERQENIRDRISNLESAFLLSERRVSQTNSNSGGNSSDNSE